jgi:hypothetical protein
MIAQSDSLLVIIDYHLPEKKKARWAWFGFGKFKDQNPETRFESLE